MSSRLLYLAALLLLLPSQVYAVASGTGVTIVNGSFSVDSTKNNFLGNSSSLSCTASTGNVIVDTTASTLSWCSSGVTYQSALGDDSGNAKSGDSATSFFSSGILEAIVGGTGNGFTEFTGPTTVKKTFTLPDASTTICTTYGVCTGYQAALSGGDVTTTSGGAIATIGDEKVTESKLDAATSPTDEYCLTYESSSGRFEWQVCGSSGVTGISDDADSTTTGSTVKLAGGSGITTTRSTDTITIATSSSEAGFLASGTLSCGAGTAGKVQVQAGPLQYCDTTATPVLRYAAYGDISGVASTALALNSDPANCTNANDFAKGVTASGVAECSQPSFSNLSGNATATQGGTGVTSYVANTMYYASSDTPSALSPVPTPTSSPMYLMYTNSTTAPSWSKVELDKSGISGILPSTNGGTGNGFTKFTGPASSEKTFTLPNASATICTTDSVCSGYGDVAKVGDCATGDCFDGTSGNTLTFKATTSGTLALKPADTTTTYTITMPGTAGSSGNFLSTNGSGTLSWSAETGDISSVGSACTTGACDSISIADTYKVDLSAVNASSTTEGLFLPQNTSCTSATAEGQVCWDSDNDTLYMGNGTTSAAVGGGSGVNSVITTVSESTVSSGTTPVYMSASGAVSTTDSYQTQTIVPAGTWANLRCVLSQVRAGATNPTVTFSYGTCGSALTSSMIVATFNNGTPNIATDTTNTRTTSANDCVNFKLTKATGLNASAWLSCTIERTAN